VAFKRAREGANLNVFWNEEVGCTARILLEQLISWVVERTERPITVVLSSSNYKHVRVVGAAWGSIIGEIEPAGAETKEEREFSASLSGEHRRRLASRKRWRIATILAHVFVGFVTVYLAFFVGQKIFLGTADRLDTGSFGLLVLLVGFGQYFVYISVPMMKIFFTGGEVMSADLHSMVKRVPANLLRNMNEPIFFERIDFLRNFGQQEALNFSELADSTKLWLRDEQNEPFEERCFNVEQGKVTLTPRGRELLKLVKDKIE